MVRLLELDLAARTRRVHVLLPETADAVVRLVAIHRGNHLRAKPLFDRVVGVHELDVRAARKRETRIPRRRYAPPERGRHAQTGVVVNVGFQYLARRVRGPVVHRDDLPARRQGRADAVQTAHERPCHVPARHNHTDNRRRLCHTSRSHYTINHPRTQYGTARESVLCRKAPG